MSARPRPAAEYKPWQRAEALMGSPSMQLRLEGLREMFTTYHTDLVGDEYARQVTFGQLHMLWHSVGEQLAGSGAPAEWLVKYASEILEVMELGANAAAGLSAQGLSLGPGTERVDDWSRYIELLRQRKQQW